MTITITDALAAWRAAERRWEGTESSGPDYLAAAIGVITAWLRYQDLVEKETGSFVLVTDDEQRYVAVSGGVQAALAYQPAELLGKQIMDIAAPDLAETTPDHWRRFIADGRQDGEFRLLSRDGAQVALRFQARAHHPIPGYHTSRLWRVDVAPA